MAEWADPDSLMHRAELARTVASKGQVSELDPRLLEDVMEVDDDNPLPGMLGDESLRRDERLALAMGGPAFQWR